jgi:hypothetical protein
MPVPSASTRSPIRTLPAPTVAFSSAMTWRRSPAPLMFTSHAEPSAVAVDSTSVLPTAAPSAAIFSAFIALAPRSPTDSRW